MSTTVCRIAMTVSVGAVLAGVSMAVNVIGTPTPARADCVVGQTQDDRGCVPYCPNDKLLDTDSGKCLDLMSAMERAMPQASELPAAPDLSALPNLGDYVGLPNPADYVGVGVPGVSVPLPPLPGPSMPDRPGLCGEAFGPPIPIPFLGFQACF
jgi:hypothetical protein